MSAPASVTAGIDPHVYANRWRILVVLCLSLMVIMIANGSLNVALPQLADDLDASTSQLQWMVDAYSLVFAGMLFTAGTLGDRFGRKAALQGGMVLFLLGAVGASISDNAGQVIAARAVMGLAAAFVMPSTLSLLANVFPPDERPKAISIWAGIAAGGAALGPPVSGFLIEHFWWGSVFLINVPLLVVAIIAGRLLLPESRNPAEHHVDVPGAVLSIVGISALVYAIIEAPSHGWGSNETLGAFALAAIALAAFVIRERRTAEPMFDLALLRDVRFSAASAGIAVCFFAMFGVMFLLAQYLQMVLGYSPFHAGLLMLPMPLTMMVVAPQAPRLVTRFGISNVVPIGMGSIALGLCILSRLGPHTPVAAIYVALLPMMVGMAITMSPFTAMIMTSVPPARAGMGSATNDTTRELGGALGVAVLGSAVTTHFRNVSLRGIDTLPADSQELARSGLPGALQAVRSAPGDVAGPLLDDARRAFTDGFGIASLVGAAVVALSAVLITGVLRRGASVPIGAPVLPASEDPIEQLGDVPLGDAPLAG
jgi:EmrB/QacA subfamily drug resistance transporter